MQIDLPKDPLESLLAKSQFPISKAIDYARFRFEDSYQKHLVLDRFIARNIKASTIGFFSSPFPSRGSHPLFFLLGRVKSGQLSKIKHDHVQVTTLMQNPGLVEFIRQSGTIAAKERFGWIYGTYDPNSSPHNRLPINTYFVHEDNYRSYFGFTFADRIATTLAPLDK